MKAYLQWLLDITLGPRCPVCLNGRFRGWRTLSAHVDINHAGDPLP